MLSGTPVYQPWKLFEWWYAYEAYAPQIFNRAGMDIVRLIEERRQRTTMTSFQAAALAQSHTLKTSVRNRLNVDRLSKGRWT